MKCDMNLFEKIASCWYIRFKSGQHIESMTIRPISVKIVDLELEDWDLGAIDFHCARFILPIISKEFDLSQGKIKNLMWNYSSKINYRENPPDTNEEWNKIKQFVRRKQKYILYKYSLIQDT